MKTPARSGLDLAWRWQRAKTEGSRDRNSSDFMEVSGLQFEAVDDEEKSGKSGADAKGFEALFVDNMMEENVEKCWNRTWQLRPMDDGSEIVSGYKTLNKEVETLVEPMGPWAVALRTRPWERQNEQRMNYSIEANMCLARAMS